MEEKTTWAHVIHYFWMNEHGEVYDKIWVGKYYRNCKMFYELRKDMLLNKVRNATIKVKFEKRNYIHIATEEMGFFTLSLTKQKFE